MSKQIILSTLFHMAEFAGILLIVWGVMKFFPGIVPNEAFKDVILVILAGLAKFARASDSIPLNDYVNDKK